MCYLLNAQAVLQLAFSDQVHSGVQGPLVLAGEDDVGPVEPGHLGDLVIDVAPAATGGDTQGGEGAHEVTARRTAENCSPVVTAQGSSSVKDGPTAQRLKLALQYCSITCTQCKNTLFLCICKLFTSALYRTCTEKCVLCTSVGKIPQIIKCLVCLLIICFVS